MIRLILVGAGGFGRELMTFAHDLHRAGGGDEVAGYIDDGGDGMLASLGYDLPWLGSISDFIPSASDRMLLGLGSPIAKQRIVERLKDKGAQFATLLHPTALVTTRTSIGEGSIFGPFSGSGTDTKVGAYVTVNSYSGLGHDSSVGDYCTLSAHVDVMGGATIGPNCLVGSHASVLPGVSIGPGAKIGAGSIVYRRVPPNATVFAPPAKLLRA